MAGDPFSRLFWSPSLLRRSAAAPATDWIKTAAAHIIKLDVPGFAKEDVKVELEEGGILLVAGEAKEETEAKDTVWHVAERGRSDFCRRFALPDSVRADNIKAQFDNGVLTVVVPKEPVQPKFRPRSIPVSKL